MNLNKNINQFRLASRELFNQFFKTHSDDPNAWIYLERFHAVEEILFQKLVSEPSETGDVTYGNVQPRIIVKLRDAESVPILLNREIDSGYWDYPVKEISQNLTLFFIDFFDWNVLATRDNRYVRIKVGSSPLQSTLFGKLGLIETFRVTFCLCDNEDVIT